MCDHEQGANHAFDRSPELTRLLSSYPRSRPPLSDAHQKIYVTHYLENRSGGGPVTHLKNRLEGWMHRRVASRQQGTHVLELGAGTLNHLSFEPHSLTYDAVEPFKEL